MITNKEMDDIDTLEAMLLKNNISLEIGSLNTAGANPENEIFRHT